MKPRCETGALRFGDDWNGVFIRGDNAIHFAMVLGQVMENPDLIRKDMIGTRMVIQGLLSTLAEANQFGAAPVQVCKDFEECLAEPDHPPGRTKP